MQQVLAPGMKNAEKANLGSQVFRISSNLHERCGAESTDIKYAFRYDRRPLPHFVAARKKMRLRDLPRGLTERSKISSELRGKAAHDTL